MFDHQPCPQISSTPKALEELKELEVFLGAQLARVEGSEEREHSPFLRALGELHQILSSGLQQVEARLVMRRKAQAAEVLRTAEAAALKQKARQPSTDNEPALGEGDMLLDFDEELLLLERQGRIHSLQFPIVLRDGLQSISVARSEGTPYQHRP
jgi:hypothetical protein